MATQGDGVPSLEFLALSFTAAWLVLWPLEHRRGVRASPYVWWVASAFGFAEVGSATFFLLAIRRIPPAEGNMAVYLWPAMVAGLAMTLGMQRFTVRQLFGIALGFASTVILLQSGGRLVLAPLGIGLALAAGLSWAIYVVIRLKWNEDRGPFLGRGAAIAALICAVLHYSSETSLWPTPRSWIAMAAVGLLPTCIANVLWDAGMRRGDRLLLTTFAYATPLSGAVILAMAGLERFTWKLVFVGVLITIAGLLSRSPPERSVSDV